MTLDQMPVIGQGIWIMGMYFLHLFQVVVFCKFVQYRMRPKACMTAIVVVLEAVCMACLLGIRFYQKMNMMSGWQWLVCSGRVELYIFLSVGMIILDLKSLRDLLRWRHTHISNRSIREVFDQAPQGLYYYEEDGAPRLINKSMWSFFKEIGHYEAWNGNRFFDWIRTNALMKNGEDSYWLEGNDQHIYQVDHYRIFTAHRAYHELKTKDITEQYTLYKNLEKKLELLQDVERQLREYEDQMVNRITQQEILDAKKHVHDELGQMILMTGWTLEKKETENYGTLMKEWASIIHLFSVRQPQSFPEYTQYEIEKAAASIGVDVEINGSIPAKKEIQNVFLAGAMECLLNAYRHAGATKLYIDVTEKDGKILLRYTNNGMIPEKPMKEGGGLRILRQAVARVNGEMCVEWTPRFAVILTLDGRKV